MSDVLAKRPKLAGELDQAEVLRLGIPQSHLDQWAWYGCSCLRRKGAVVRLSRRPGPDGQWFYRQNEIDRVLRCRKPLPSFEDASGRKWLDTASAADHLQCSQVTLHAWWNRGCSWLDWKLKPRQVLTYDPAAAGGFQKRYYWRLDDLETIRESQRRNSPERRSQRKVRQAGKQTAGFGPGPGADLTLSEIARSLQVGKGTAAHWAKRCVYLPEARGLQPTGRRQGLTGRPGQVYARADVELIRENRRKAWGGTCIIAGKLYRSARNAETTYAFISAAELAHWKRQKRCVWMPNKAMLDNRDYRPCCRGRIPGDTVTVFEDSHLSLVNDILARRAEDLQALRQLLLSRPIPAATVRQHMAVRGVKKDRLLCLCRQLGVIPRLKSGHPGDPYVYYLPGAEADKGDSNVQNQPAGQPVPVEDPPTPAPDDKPAKRSRGRKPGWKDKKAAQRHEDIRADWKAGTYDTITALAEAHHVDRTTASKIVSGKA